MAERDPKEDDEQVACRVLQRRNLVYNHPVHSSGPNAVSHSAVVAESQWLGLVEEEAWHDYR